MGGRSRARHRALARHGHRAARARRSPTSRRLSHRCGRLPARRSPRTSSLRRPSIAARGDVTLRVLATAPSMAGLYRLDQLIAAMATRTLWLTGCVFRRRRAVRAGAAGRGARRRRREAARPRHERRAAGRRICRARVIGRCSKPAFASSNGTARCCTRKRRSRTGGGRVWARPISISRAGSATTSSTSRSKTCRVARAMAEMYEQRSRARDRDRAGPAQPRARRA